MVALPVPLPARLLPLARGRRAMGAASGPTKLAAWAAGAAIAAVAGCARPPDTTITPAEFDRDRLARADLVAAIAADHEALATLIAMDRFETPGAIYSDPELRRIAKRLVDQTRALDRLASTDVLAPGAP